MVTVLNQKKTDSYLRQLPLLDFTAKLYPKTDLGDVYIVCAQHLVSTTYSLFYTLVQLGVKPENISAIGKCYSTDPQAFAELKRLGIDVCPTSLSFDSHKPFDEQYRSNIKKFIKSRAQKILDSDSRKIIILDDGGELIPEATEALKQPQNAVGIEQTSAGYHKLQKNTLQLPIINVARSQAKLQYESPIIANLVMDTLEKGMSQLNLKPGKALIIGKGAIGSHIEDLLSSPHETETYDHQISRSSIRKEDFDRSLPKFDLIIGCTGSQVLTSEQFNLLKSNAVLVSASSSDREFNAVFLRKKVPSDNNCHQHLNIEGKWLINCGFPINFSSDFRSIDCDKLQLTRSLLLTAILQADAQENLKTGFIALDHENQRDIIQQFLHLSREENILNAV